VWHVWGTGDVHTEFWWGDGREGDHFQDLLLHGRIILKRIFKKWDGEAWIYLAQVAGACECGNESSRSIKFGKFRD